MLKVFNISLSIKYSYGCRVTYIRFLEILGHRFKNCISKSIKWKNTLEHFKMGYNYLLLT